MPSGLPPQTLAETRGLEGLVVYFPRASIRGANLQRVAQAFAIATVALVVLFLARSGTLFTALIVGLALVVPATLVTGRLFERRELRELTVRLDARSLSVDDERFLWSELASVDWRDTSSPEVVELVLARRDGGERVFLVDRRSSISDPVGVTRKQRAWLVREATQAIEGAGDRHQVPDALQDVVRR